MRCCLTRHRNWNHIYLTLPSPFLHLISFLTLFHHFLLLNLCRWCHCRRYPSTSQYHLFSTLFLDCALGHIILLVGVLKGWVWGLGWRRQLLDGICLVGWGIIGIFLLFWDLGYSGTQRIHRLAKIILEQFLVGLADWGFGQLIHFMRNFMSIPVIFILNNLIPSPFFYNFILFLQINCDLNRFVWTLS